MKKFIIFLILIFVLGLTPINFSNATSIATRLKGRILLQIESNGEAWYVNPDNEKRYYLGRPADAFQVMRKLGLGISNNDFNSFNGYAPSRLSGKILLKVEDSGKAYYVNPLDLKMHYLGRPADAFNIMRNLGLGISDNDLLQIEDKTNSNFPAINNNNSVKITAVNELVDAVVEIKCFGEEILSIGSGSLINDNNEYYVQTNYHVISDPELLMCEAILHGSDKNNGGIYDLDLENLFTYNEMTDYVIIPILGPQEKSIPTPTELSKLNYSVGYMDVCDEKMPLGTKVYTIGFPTYTEETYNILGLEIIHHHLAITDGIISSYYISDVDLPGKDYYITAAIDAGNSGGIALAEKNGNLCLLGIPTWVKEGTYVNQGIVQNILNINYSDE